MPGAEVGCLRLTLFDSSGCSTGFTDAPMGFGCSQVIGLLCVHDSMDVPTCVMGDPIGTKCSRVL